MTWLPVSSLIPLERNVRHYRYFGPLLSFWTEKVASRNLSTKLTLGWSQSMRIDITTLACITSPSSIHFAKSLAAKALMYPMLLKTVTDNSQIDSWISITRQLQFVP